MLLGGVVPGGVGAEQLAVQADLDGGADDSELDLLTPRPADAGRAAGHERVESAKLIDTRVISVVSLPAVDPAARHSRLDTAPTVKNQTPPTAAVATCQMPLTASVINA